MYTHNQLSPTNKPLDYPVTFTHTHTHTHTPLILNYCASQNYRDHASGTLGGLLMLRFGYFHH